MFSLESSKNVPCLFGGSTRVPKRVVGRARSRTLDLSLSTALLSPCFRCANPPKAIELVSIQFACLIILITRPLVPEVAMGQCLHPTSVVS
jgi:hypothetical protein